MHVEKNNEYVGESVTEAWSIKHVFGTWGMRVMRKKESSGRAVTVVR